MDTVVEVEYEGDPAPWDTPTTVSTPPVNGAFEEDPNHALEEDLNTIALFFAGGEDDQSEAEEVIWSRLSAKKACNTCPSWEAFYQMHCDEVNARYEALVAS